MEQEKEQAIAGRDNLSLQQIRLIREKSIVAERNQKFTECHVGLANSILKFMSYDLGQAFVLKRDLFREGVLSKRVLDHLLLRIMENAPLVEIVQFYLLILITSQPKPKDLQIIRSNISARYGVSADFLLIHLMGLDCCLLSRPNHGSRTSVLPTLFGMMKTSTQNGPTACLLLTTETSPMSSIAEHLFLCGWLRENSRPFCPLVPEKMHSRALLEEDPVLILP